MQTGLTSKELYCLPRGQVRDVKRMFLTLVQLSEYYPLLIFQVGSDEVSTKIAGTIEKDFRTFRQLVKGSGTELVFSFSLPVTGDDERRNRKMKKILRS